MTNTNIAFLAYAIQLAVEYSKYFDAWITWVMAMLVMHVLRAHIWVMLEYWILRKLEMCTSK